MNVINQVVAEDYSLYCGDSIEVMEGIPESSIGLSVFSPPFPGMYVYSNSPRDVGNVTGLDQMIQHFGKLTPHLLRVTMPGRLCCVHLCQLPARQSHDGYIGLKDFRGRVIDLYEQGGWIFAGEVTIDKNPQMQAQRNKEMGLLFKSLGTDSSVMRMGLADYMLYFRKPGKNPKPIRAGISPKYNPGGGWITEEEWIEWAAPVWYRNVALGRTVALAQPEYPALFAKAFQYRVNGNTALNGIQETDVLNVEQARETDDERHLCPLQLGVIERAVKLWSAPGDTVLDPFSGIGSTGYESVRLGRKYVGIELKESYWRSSVTNLERAIAAKESPTLFDFADMAAVR